MKKTFHPWDIEQSRNILLWNFWRIVLD